MNIFIVFIIFIFSPSVFCCKKNTDCQNTCYMGQDLCYMKHTFPGEEDEGFCDGGNVFSSGSCLKKKSLGENSCDNDNNFCVTRLCNNNQCKHRTSGCASFSDCIGAFVDYTGDFFQKETSEGVENFVQKNEDDTEVNDLQQNCDQPSGGPNCPPQPCTGYGKIRKKNKRRRLSDIELLNDKTPGKLISRSLIEKINSEQDYIKKRKLIEVLEEIKKLLSEGLIISQEVDQCYYIVKNKDFIKPNKTCTKKNPPVFQKSTEIDFCKDRKCSATGDVKVCVKGPIYFSLTPNLRFDLTTFNFGIGAGFLFDTSSLVTNIISTGKVECSIDRDWTLSSRITLFKKPIKFGAVSLMVEINGQITARIHGEFIANSKTEISLGFEQFELADSFQLDLNLGDSKKSCLNIKNDVSIPDAPEFNNCETPTVFGRRLIDRKLLDAKFKPNLNYIKSSGTTKAKLTASIQGELSLVINGVQTEVGIGGDLVLVGEADGSASSEGETCIKGSANILGGLRIGTYIPSFDLLETIGNFGKQQCSHSLEILDKIRRRRLNDHTFNKSIFHKDNLNKIPNDILEKKDWRMRVLTANRKLSDRYGDACNSDYNNRKEVVEKELQTFDGRIGICNILIDFGMSIIKDPEICVREYSNCEIIYKIDKINLGEIKSGCGKSDGIITIEDYKCEPFKTHIDENYKSSCKYEIDWVLIIILIVSLIIIIILGKIIYKKYKK